MTTKTMAGGAAAPQPTLAELVETDFLICTQCNQRFTSPTLLPCLHVFCRPCLAALPRDDVTTNGSDVPDRSDVVAKSNRGDKNNTTTNSQVSLSDSDDVIVNGTRSDVPTIVITNESNDIKTPTMMTLRCPLCRSRVTTPRDAPPVPFLQSLCQLHAFKHGSSRVCAYCKFDGKGSEPAVSLCLDCSDDMCQPCAQAHRKTRVTRDHVIAPYEQIHLGLFDHDIRACHTPRCPRHAQELDHFCCDCTQLACRACQGEAHRGHKLHSVENAVSLLQPEASSFVRGLRKRVPALSQYQLFLQAQLRKVQEKRQELSQAVHKQARDIHSMVDQYRDSLLADVTATFDKETSDIQSRSQDLDVAKQSLESNAQLLGNLLAIGSAPEVLQLHPAIMSRLKQLIHMKTDAMVTRLAAAFHAGPASQQNMRIMFGTLDMQRAPVEQEEVAPTARLSVSTLLPEPLDPPLLVCSLPVKQDADSKEVWPSGLHIRKKKMVVVDRDNKKVKVFDCSTQPPTLKFVFTGKGEHRLINPFDAALLENGVVVVSDNGAEKVKVFDCTGSWIGDLKGDFRHPRGVSVNSDGHLVVVDGYLLRLTVHDPDSGQVLQTIPTAGSKDSKVLVDPFYVACTEQGHFVVTDHAAPNIKVFDKGGQHLQTYGTYGTSAREVLKPYGVCIDRYGQMFVADSDNHRVHLLLPDGTFARFLLTHTHKVAHPVTLAIDQDGHLVVGEAFGNIKFFKYL